MLWNKIGSAYCINLKSRKDRLKEASRVFKKIKLDINFHVVDKHPNGGTQGCFESHIQIITKAFERGDERCIIFEDDATPTKYLNNKVLRKCIRFMDKHKTWNIFYLGVLPDIRRYPTHIIEKGIYKLQGICTHAYVIHRRLMEKLANMKYAGIPIDYFYMQLNECYAIYPTLFYQGLSKSDITENSWYNSFRTEGLVKNYYRMQEMYAYYIRTPLLSAKMTLFLILFFVYYTRTKNLVNSLFFFLIMLYIF